ncbi:MAG TPA: hypothetical protein VFA76_13165 [Terriglobales bacterium]|nr:hypothetical protein [Terriglobales bacterium]
MNAGDPAKDLSTELDTDALEVAPGAAHEQLQGWVPELASDEELRAALEQAFDYRGDVLITRKDGSKIEGYIFDRRNGRTLADSLVRIISQDNQKTSVSYSDIAALAFTGRDMAAGKSWETWVRQYWQKKMAGESISLHPEKLE